MLMIPSRSMTTTSRRVRFFARIRSTSFATRRSPDAESMVYAPQWRRDGVTRSPFFSDYGWNEAVRDQCGTPRVIPDLDLATARSPNLPLA